MIVAIDGPAGSGKSSTARALAERLGFLYLDTGAMYRAVAWLFLRDGAQVSDATAASLLGSTAFEIRHVAGEMAILVNELDITAAIRSREVTALSSKVSALPAVRNYMVDAQRRIARRESEQGGGVIVEGRDIGTVVFPDAEVKIYLDADMQIRAQRRLAEMKADEAPVRAETVEAEIRERDLRDTRRKISPLRKADDSITIDTSSLTPDEQVRRIESIIRERSNKSFVKE